MAISLGQLDLEALKNYLKIVQGFRTVNDPAMDTENVDGVAASLIAIASLIDGQLIKDENGEGRRDVVNNALNLLRIDEYGGQTIITADDVLTEEEGESLKRTAREAAKSTADDMRQLRNEMYHLKTKMIKSGSVTFDQVYNGWIDPFIHYIDTEESMDGRFTKDAFPISNNGVGSFEVSCPKDTYLEGQSAVLLSADGVAIYADEITSIDYDGNNPEIVLGNGDTFIDVTPRTMQKSYGLYDKGQFIFANDQANLINTDNAVNMIYKDGPNRIKVFEMNNPNQAMGIGTVIEVPAELDENYLNAIGLSIRCKGKPAGIVWCELYHYNEERIYDPNYIVATSDSLNSDNVTSQWKTHKFTFRDADIRLESGHKYLLLIKGTVADTENVWYIGGFEEECNLMVHRDTYEYIGTMVLDEILPNPNTNRISDVFVALYTTETQQVLLNYSKYGAYTGTFDLEHALARRVRVSFNPNLNGRQSNPETFRVEDYYTVNVIGQTLEGEFVKGEFDGEIKEYNHVVIANNEMSANEFVYDFILPKEVVKVEFQIVYSNPGTVDASKHGSLFSVVVSTDNAYIEDESQEGEF